MNGQKEACQQHVQLQLQLHHHGLWIWKHIKLCLLLLTPPLQDRCQRNGMNALHWLGYTTRHILKPIFLLQEFIWVVLNAMTKITTAAVWREKTMEVKSRYIVIHNPTQHLHASLFRGSRISLFVERYMKFFFKFKIQIQTQTQTSGGAWFGKWHGQCGCYRP